MLKNCLIIGDLNIDLIFSCMKNIPKLGHEVLSEKSVLGIGGSCGLF